MASPVKDAAWLAWIERLVAETSSELPPGLFHCLLDDQPNHLVAESALRQQAWEDLAGRPLVLHPDCCITQGEALPAEFAGNLSSLDHFALQGPVVWLRDPGTQMVQPFWLNKELAATLRGLKSGDLAPAFRRRAKSPKACHGRDSRAERSCHAPSAAMGKKSE